MKFIPKHPYDPHLKKYARKLRNNATISEIVLWKYLKGKQMLGYDFHRQKPILNYICDFYCLKLEMYIEVDGGYHNTEEQIQKDKLREEALLKLGLKGCRIPHKAVMNNMPYTLSLIEGFIKTREEELGISRDGDK